MLGFVVRRFAATLLVLLIASFLVYQLTAISGDPLAEVRAAGGREVVQRVAYLTEVLDLETPPIFRYFLWLGGAAGCLVGQCDLGLSVARGMIPVTEAVSTAMFSTIQLVTAATILSILVGVAIGMTTALRQYSGYDYTVTFFAFVFYSLPIFWVAVLLKEYGAIRFNRFLAEPVIPPDVAVPLVLALGLVISGVVGGGLRTRAVSALITVVLSGTTIVFLNVTQWLKSPSLGVIGILFVSLVIAGVALLLTVGFGNRRAVAIVAGTAAATAALWLPFQYLFFYLPNPLGVMLASVLMALVGVLLALTFGGDSRREVARTAALVGFLGGLVLVADEALQHWEIFTDRLSIQTGFISTIGSRTPTIASENNMWLNILDSYSHLILPTAALMIISVAGYTRYARASLLEVMNQDYVRTARSKGLNERTVVVRHGMRNALLPIATIVPVDITSIIGGAVITERVFAWEGMGQLFLKGLAAVDVNLVMGYVLVVGLMAVVGNVIADVLYSALDPRIRINP